MFYALAQAQSGGGAEIPAPYFASGEVGNVNATTVVVVLSESVLPCDFEAGVLIKKNGVTQTISTAVQQVDLKTIRYVIVGAVVFGDVVTWEYDADTGEIVSAIGDVPMVDAVEDVTNNVVTNPLTSVPWVAQYKFNGDGNDSVGTNHLTNNNAATFVAGKIDQATQLESALTQFWSHISAPAFLNDAGDFLITVWAYADSNGSGGGELASKDNGGGGSRDYWLDWNSGKPDWYVWTSTNLFNVTWGSTLALSTWHLVVCYYDSNAQTIGISVNNEAFVTASATGTPHAGTDSFRVGFRDGVKFDGRIDDLLLAKGAGSVLNTLEMDALWNGGDGTETIT